MINISTYVKMILKKKHMTNTDLLRKINKLEEKSGVKERTVKQNITNYLNDYWHWGYSFARKVEVALELEDKTLLNLLPKPKSESQKRIYKEVLKKWKRD